MIKLLRLATLLLLLTLVFHLKIAAQSVCDSVSWIAPLPQGNNLNAVTNTDLNTFYAAGDYGTVLKSSDGGQHWSVLNTNSIMDFSSIFFTDTNTGYIAGKSGTIFKTSNAGLSWQALSVPGTPNFSTIYFTDANTGYAAGGDASGGVIVKTTNAGASWSILPSPAISNIVSISFTGTTGYFTESNPNELLKTINGGATWEVKNPGGIEKNTSGSFPTTATGYISSFKYPTMQRSYVSKIMKTTDGGDNWVAVYDQMDRTGQDQYLFFLNANEGFRSGRVTNLEKTTDGGVTWDSVGAGYYRSIVFSDMNNGVAVGFSGIISTTSDRGATWNKVIGVPVSFLSVSFTDINTGYAVVGDGSIYKTTDAAKNWTMVRPGDSFTSLNKIYFIDQNTGFALGSTESVLKTTDAGLSWTKQSLFAYSILRDIFFIDSSTGFIVDDAGDIFKTTDGGTVWTKSTITPNVYLGSIFFTSPQIGYIVGGISGFYTEATIFKTTDGGGSWTLMHSGTTHPLMSVYFTDANTGYATGYDKTLIKTTNAGLTWNTLNTPAQDMTTFYKVKFTDKDNGYLIGTEILHTVNAGNSWTVLKSSQYTQQDVSFPVPNTGYSVGYGSILKISNCSGGTIHGDTSVCKGSTISYNIDSLSGISYSWTVSGGGTISGTGKKVEVNWNSTGTYTITSTPSSGTPMTLTIHVDQVLPASVASILGNTSAMSGNTFIYKVSNPVAGVNYNWSLSGGGIISGLGDTASVKWISTGTYTISVTPSNYCDAGQVTTLLVNVNGHVVHSCNEIDCICPGVSSDLTSVSYANTDIGIAVGDQGVILKTFDGGISWISLRSNTIDYLSLVKMLNKEVAIAVGDNGTILKTIDGGASWNSLNSGVNEILFSVFFIDLNNGYAVGGNGTILKTTDGGVNWEVYHYTSAVKLNAVFFINASIGFVGGANGTLLKTTDGGTTWNPVQATTNDLYSIDFVDATTGFIAGDLGRLIKTSDGGNNWITLNSNSQEILYGISFANTSKGFAVGTNGAILKTTDGGSSWGKIESGTLNELVTVTTVNTDTAYAVGFGGTAFKIFSGISCQPGPITGDTLVNINTTTCYSTDDVNGLTYSWSLSEGGTITSSGNSCTINWTSTGIHILTMTPSTGVEQILKIDVLNSVSSVTSKKALLSFTVYPNPSQGNFQVDFQTEGIYSGKLINGMGIVVWSGNLNDISNKIVCENMAKGIYYLQITSENNTGVNKLVME